MTLMIAVRDTFYTNSKGDKDLSTMRKEWSALTEKDKTDLTAWFRAEGVVIDDTPSTKVLDGRS